LINKKRLPSPAGYFACGNEYFLPAAPWTDFVCLRGFFVFLNIFQNILRKVGKFAILNVLVMKGKTSPAFADAKGGEFLKPNSHELDKQRVFDSYCKKVLKNEARDYHREMKRRRNKEISFSALSRKELEQLSTTDIYFATEQIFNVLGDDIIVTNESVAEALRNLPEQRNRDIILLYYFLELTDREIGKKLDMIRSTVQNRRKSTLRELKKIIEEENGDENENNKH
jgi:RNA polymerase sigma factor (sigma-70 family)